MADRFPLIVDSSAEQLQELAVGDNLNLASSGLINADNIQTSGLNVGVMTATSFIGDGSQLTNLPAAGSSTELTASGTLADGSKVIVNADGTVSVVAQTETTGSGSGSPTTFNSGATNYIGSTFDSTNNKVVIAYSDYSNNYVGTAVVGTVSGTSISFGTPVVFNSATQGSYHISPVYDSSSDKVVIAYRDDGNSARGTAIVGEISGTSISFGSAVTFTNNLSNYISATFDSTNNKVVFAYSDYSNSTYGTAVVGTVSGTSISFGTPVVFNSGATYYSSAIYDSSNNKVVISYQDNGNSGRGTAIVGTVSGTSISFGTSTAYESSNTYADAKIIYDSTNNKVVIAYSMTGSGKAVVGTVSGTSISFGSASTFTSSTCNFVGGAYDSTNQKVVITYSDHGNSYIATAIVGTVSGTSISFDSGSKFTYTDDMSGYTTAIYDTSNDKVVIAYRDDGSSSTNHGKAFVYATTSGFPLHQLGSPTVFEAADSSHIVSTYDPSNQKVVIAYSDNGNSGYGTAIVGTVSGTSITFGTPVVYNSGGTPWPGMTYDSTTNQIVIAYRDDSNSSYGTAIVGTVSGTSISFGSKAVYNSADSRYNTIAYDSSNNKVVIAYRDQGHSQYGKAIVGTISGTSISFGSEVNLSTNGTTNYTSAIYDPSNQKVVIAYMDYGNNYQGTVRVGTVSGTSISFGTPVVFDSSGNEVTTVYDSTNGKIVIAYADHTNNNYGTAIVGTVSGTSMTFGTPVVFNSTGSTSYISSAYDSTNQKVVITFKYTTTEGVLTTATISGNSISFGSPVVYETSEMFYNAAVYDSSNDRVVISYMDSGDNDYGKSVVFSPVTITTNLTAENYIGISDGAYSNGQTSTIQLIGSVDDAQSSLTPGQKYYVQDDGTLAESGSVLAGTAIASTKLLIKK